MPAEAEAVEAVVAVVAVEADVCTVDMSASFNWVELVGADGGFARELVGHVRRSLAALAVVG